MPNFLTLDDLDCAGKTVLVRGDLNVPLQDGKVMDSTRIDRLKPTVDTILDQGGKVVLMSHFGRPKGKRDPACSLKPIVPALIRCLGRPVMFIEDCIGAEAEDRVAALNPGEVALLENVRFYPGEAANDAEFAQALAKLGDFYVNDGFSTAHRKHASTTALAQLLPAAAGRLMQAELTALDEGLESPDRPVAALVGGAKISTKLDLLANLVTKMDCLILGGGMANTFLAAGGIGMGKSLHEPDMAEQARDIQRIARDHGCEILLPVDGLAARVFEANAPYAVVPVRDVPADAMLLDIGPASVQAIKERIEKSRTLVWNGPLGAFEITPFDSGTRAIARYAAERTKAGKLFSVGGGGDTLAALAKAGVVRGTETDFSYASTAGGAFLEWLEGKTLPAVAALQPSHEAVAV